MNELVVESPGRINMIGEHIDYNGGTVMPAAIDKKLLIYIKIWCFITIINYYE